MNDLQLPLQAIFKPIINTYSKLPGAKPPLKDSKVVNQQAAAEGVLHVQTDQPAAQQPPNLQHKEEQSCVLTSTYTSANFFLNAQ